LVTNTALEGADVLRNYKNQPYLEKKAQPPEIGAGSGTGLFEKARTDRSHAVALYHCPDVDSFDGAAHSEEHGARRNGIPAYPATGHEDPEADLVEHPVLL